MKHLVLTDFARKRVFNPDLPGTTITDRSPEQFEKEANLFFEEQQSELHFRAQLRGYAPFCDLLVYDNWTGASAGTMRITDENKHLLRSDYLSRTADELPVLTRWFEMDDIPKADYLVLAVYSAEQLKKEGAPIDGRWGIVAVLGQMQPNEEPMPPITAMRNALGMAEGGSGVPLDRKNYLHSVEFWRKHAVVKRSLTKTRKSDPKVLE